MQKNYILLILSLTLLSLYTHTILAQPIDLKLKKLIMDSGKKEITESAENIEVMMWREEEIHLQPDEKRLKLYTRIAFAGVMRMH